MTQIKKITDKQGNDIYLRTHTKAVVDDNGYTAESRLQAMQDEINQAQLAVGAVPSDLTPTKSSTNWVTSGGLYNSFEKITDELVIEEDVDLSLLPSVSFYIYQQKWHTADNGAFVKVVNVLPNKKVRIVSDETYGVSVFFLTEFHRPTNNSNVVGYYGHDQFQADTNTIIDIPDNVHYLVFQDDHNMSSGGSTSIPYSVGIIKELNNEVNKHTEEITDIQKCFTNVIEQYSSANCVNTDKILLVDGNLMAFGGMTASDYIQIPENVDFIEYSDVYGINNYVFCGLVLCDSSYKAVWFNTVNSGTIVLSDYPDAKYIRFMGNNSSVSVKLTNISSGNLSSINGSDTLRWYGSSDIDGTHNLPANNYYYSLNNPCEENGIIQAISGYFSTAGDAKIYLGVIDQNGYIIVRDTFTISVTTGVCNIDVSARNIAINKNEYVFLNGSDGTANTRFNIDTNVSPKGISSDATGICEVRNDGIYFSLNWTVNTHKPSFQEVADNIEGITEQIDNNTINIEKLQNNKKYFIDDSVTNRTYQLIVRNGVLSLILSQFSNALILGNSITKHPIKENVWFGEWGMAATKAEYDFVHIVEEGLKTKDANAVCSCLNISDWERDFTTSLSSLIGNQLSSSTDLVVIRLGENVPSANMPNFATAIGELISYIYSVTPTVRIVITGGFWTNTSLEEQITTAANNNGIDYIRLNNLDTNYYKETLGHYVYGEDSQIHEITNSGVAIHPNNKGMAAIANAILSCVGYAPVDKKYMLQTVTVDGTTGTMWVLSE